jgi:hypothetical protein
MDRRSSAFAIRHLVIALVAATFALALPTRDAATVTMPAQMSSERPPPAPVILAQGRCYNGRCF